MSFVGRPYQYVLDAERRAVPLDDILSWSRFMTDQGKCRVAHTGLDRGFISTVFLGLDHAHWGGPPLLFETMIFGGPLDQLQTRCSTWQEAEAMHAAALASARAAGYRNRTSGNAHQRRTRLRQRLQEAAAT